ncbi:MAG: hypothetical protein ACLQVN_18235 [Bryobacteraceae bacterium]
MSDPSTYWLTFMNVALGVLTLIGCLAVAIGVVHELAARRKKAVPHLDREVANLVASFQDGHAFHTPELGLTMADGGEDVNKKEKR